MPAVATKKQLLDRRIADQNAVYCHRFTVDGKYRRPLYRDSKRELVRFLFKSVFRPMKTTASRDRLCDLV